MMTGLVGIVMRCRLFESLAVTKRIVLTPWFAAREDNGPSRQLDIDPERFDVRNTLNPTEELAETVPIAHDVDVAELETVE